MKRKAPFSLFNLNPFAKVLGILTLAGALALAALGQFFLIQKEVPWTLFPGLALCLLAGFLFIKANEPKGEKKVREQAFSPRLEFSLFALIMAVALFFRVYRLDQFPAGIFTDEACEGYGALRILHEGWRPFYQIFQLLVWDPPMYYLLALWFKFIAATKTHLFLFSVLLSLLSFPLIYWTSRQLAGPRTALLSLFVLAVMRWDITYSRTCHPAIQLPFYMFGALAFWLYGIEKRKNWALGMAGLFFAGGFYIYQAYKAFILLMLIYVIYEWFFGGSKTKIPWKNLLVFSLPAFLFSAPIWSYWLWDRAIDPRAKELFIFPGILKDGSLLPLWKHFLGTALMFNREGDSWFLHNLPYHRMLDDFTGVLWILGLVLALSRLKRRKYFYPAVGLGVMCLPAFLSIAATHGSRAFGTVPFLALLAGLALSKIWDQKASLKTAFARGSLTLILILGLGGMTFQNFRTYFFEQAVNVDCWRGPATDATLVGEKIAREGNQEEFYLSPVFFGHYSVLFLGYFQKDHMREFELPKSLTLPDLPSGRGALFALAEGQSGLLSLLQDLYPGGETETAQDPWDKTLVHFYRVTWAEVERGRKNAEKFLNSNHGLRGTYFSSADLTGKPALVQIDPLLNFTFRTDLPLRNFNTLSVRWEGHLKTEEAGHYQFLALSTDPAALILDGKKLFAGSSSMGELYLKKGSHSLVLLFKKNSGVDTALTLAWKIPGSQKFEVVPYSALSH